MNTYAELANLRAWELAHRIIARIQRDSDFFHFWHYVGTVGQWNTSRK